MSAQGVGRPCSNCQLIEKPTAAKHRACACLGDGVLYCSQKCQREHWKSTHKHECTTRTKKGNSRGAVPRRKVPSKDMIEKAMHGFVSGTAEHPMPGTEEFEAVKIAMRQTLDKTTAPSQRSHKLPKNMAGQHAGALQELERFEEMEREWFRRTPDAPNWAAGTGFSTTAKTLAYFERDTEPAPEPQGVESPAVVTPAAVELRHAANAGDVAAVASVTRLSAAAGPAAPAGPAIAGPAAAATPRQPQHTSIGVDDDIIVD